MPTVLSRSGFDVRIYFNDHAPPHVHVIHQFGEARIGLIPVMILSVHGNGAKFVFPADLAQGIAGASVNNLSRIEISPSGEGLRWPTLDADFSLPELMRGIVGNKAWMQRLKRQVQRTSS
jgi:hypothetical protein